MTTPFVFPYRTVPIPGGAARIPLMPLRLHNGSTWLDVDGLIDSGAAVSVLPFDIGTRLGLDWDAEPILIRLTGNLAAQPAKAIILAAEVNGFAPVRLSFAWSRMTGIPLLLGQTNFSNEFDICFRRTRGQFTVAPRTP